VFLLDNNSILKRYNDTYTRWRISNAPCIVQRSSNSGACVAMSTMLQDSLMLYEGTDTTPLAHFGR
jgi:hypothetical protein